jgi:hypothetical protein
MTKQRVAIFKPYAFSEGEKIRIEGGPRKGDWEIISLSERKVKLRCPISGREVEWDRFCFHAETLDESPWPLED